MIDILRGFALLGILLVNVQVMAGPHMGASGQPVMSRVDEAAGWLVTALVSAKFYLLFSFLFGYSFTLQRASAERAGIPFAPCHLRRFVCLFLMGVAHCVVLFSGDVLMVYAVLSLILFALRDISPRSAIWTAAWLVLGCAACLLAWGLLTVAYGTRVPSQEVTAVFQERMAAHRGDAGSIVQAHLRSLRDGLGWTLVYSADMLAAFLVGLAAGRRGVLARTSQYRAQMVRITVGGLPIGLAGGVAMAICRNGPLDARWHNVGSAVGVLTAPALTAAYVCGLLLLVHSSPGRWVGDALAPAGRVALTNYLAQSLAAAVVFTGYGLGWYGRFGTTVLLSGCLGFYATQLVWSKCLLRSTRYGPAEWLLRSATFAHRP
ncbi:DUF418 domain-containing protein [Streptomyces sp. NPDC049744]|uniref:DUF418 domain-containing protein n=1 Tax=Streptomyces sp. NPDC049744 TaxID=3154359 RepID=UPI00343A3BF2